jgi:HlyD family secretion protein
VIITNVEADVLTVPNSAVKTDSSGSSFVQTLDANGQPQNVTVQIGLADDTNTEITGGLNEGDKVVTQTITSSSAATSQTSSTANRTTGGFGGGASSLGGAARILR